MIRMVGLVLVTAALALSQGGQEPAAGVKLWAALAVSEPIFDRGGVDQMQVSFADYNEGDATADPKIESSHLLINGVEPRDWPLVIGNGPRGKIFYSLPPGKTLQFGYGLGPRYFLDPGIYKLRWKGENFESPELTFRVVP
jgi:hypothetical protein